MSAFCMNHKVFHILDKNDGAIMPQEEICRNRIISENYRDFIVNQLRGNIFDSISSEELCEQSMEYLYKTIYVDGTMADPINFEKYAYN